MGNVCIIIHFRERFPVTHEPTNIAKWIETDELYEVRLRS